MERRFHYLSITRALSLLLSLWRFLSFCPPASCLLSLPFLPSALFLLLSPRLSRRAPPLSVSLMAPGWRGLFAAARGPRQAEDGRRWPRAGGSSWARGGGCGTGRRSPWLCPRRSQRPLPLPALARCWRPWQLEPRSQERLGQACDRRRPRRVWEVSSRRGPCCWLSLWPSGLSRSLGA